MCECPFYSYQILMLTSAPFLRAGNQSIRRTVEGLRERGATVDVWLLSSHTGGAGDLPGGTRCFPPFRSAQSRLRRHRQRRRCDLPQPNEPSSGAVRDLTAVVDYRNDEVSHWKVSLPAVAAYSARALVAALRDARSVRNCDALWGYERGGVLPAALLARVFGKPLITSFQGTSLKYYWQRYGKAGALLRLPLDVLALSVRADLVLMTDDGTGGNSVLERLGHSPQRVVFVPNGVDLPELAGLVPRVKASLGLADGEQLYVVSTRLVVHKRLDRALALAAELTTRGAPAFRLFVVGDGPDRGYLERETRRRGLTYRVRFTGAMPYRESLALLAAADMVWSFQEGSNLTNAVQDALALGKTVVTLDDGSLEGFLKRSAPKCCKLLLTVPLQRFPQGAADAICRFAGERTATPAEHLLEVWTWSERSEAVYAHVCALLGRRRNRGRT